MVRKGQTGAAHEDGMTPEMAARLRSIGERVLEGNEQALNWYYHGGPLPL